MSTPATVLVTGGTGFLGSNLVRRLAGTAHPLVVVKRSSSKLARLAGLESRIRCYDVDRVPMRAIFDEHPIGVIVHCATNYGRRTEPPTDIIEANLLLPLSLLQLGERHGSSVFINSDTILDKRVNHYSLSKHQFLEWLPVFSERLVCANVALEHFYGPYDDPSKFVSHVVQRLLTDDPVLSLTPGGQRRDFVFIDDVVEAFLTILEFSLGATPGLYRYEVGTGASITIADFVRLAKTLSANERTRLDFGALPYREREVMESHADVRSLLALGWQPRVALRDGLCRTITLEREHLLSCAT